MNIVQKLINHIKAAYPCIAIQTVEEKRAQADVIAAIKGADRKVATWSASEGIVYLDTASKVSDSTDLLDALRIIHSKPKDDTIYIMRDINQWPIERDPVAARVLRDAITDAPERGCPIIIIAPEFRPMKSIEKLVTIIDYSLPNQTELTEIANNIAEGVSSKKSKPKKIDPDVIRALTGLSTTEAENALALSLIETGAFSPEVIYREKTAAVRRSGLLEIIDPDPRGLDAVGGLENLKTWIIDRKTSYSPEAEAYGLPAPKGCILVGVPGTGKSLSAKAFGTALGVPTLKLNVGSLFNSLVGESEGRARDALNLAEAIAPCVLWVDEVDKGFSGSSGSGDNDSGVTRRVFDTMLQWMDSQKNVFLVMTANQVEHLPPEFLRKGRIDDLFTIDLPHLLEREQIASIHIKKRGRDPQNFDIAKVAAATDTFTGVEIESTIVSAMIAAFNDGKREFTTADILAAAQNLVPLAKTMAEKIEAIRRWGDGRARPASKPQEQQPKSPNVRKIKS